MENLTLCGVRESIEAKYKIREKKTRANVKEKLNRMLKQSRKFLG
jgi:hypothetical protein